MKIVQRPGPKPTRKSRIARYLGLLQDLNLARTTGDDALVRELEKQLSSADAAARDRLASRTRRSRT